MKIKKKIKIKNLKVRNKILKKFENEVVYDLWTTRLVEMVGF